MLRLRDSSDYILFLKKREKSSAKNYLPATDFALSEMFVSSRRAGSAFMMFVSSRRAGSAFMIFKNKNEKVSKARAETVM